MPRAYRNLVIELLGGKCVDCTSTEDLEIDHIIPRSQGGLDTASNVRLLCHHCHWTKHKTFRRYKSLKREAPKEPRPKKQKELTPVDVALIRAGI